MAHVVSQELAQEVVQRVQGAGRNLMDVLFVDLRDTGRMNVQREELPYHRSSSSNRGGGQEGIPES